MDRSGQFLALEKISLPISPSEYFVLLIKKARVKTPRQEILPRIFIISEIDSPLFIKVPDSNASAPHFF